MKSFYNISKGQIITLWIFGVIGWLLAAAQADGGSEFAGLFLWLIPLILIFYSLGWKSKRSVNSQMDSSINRPSIVRRFKKIIIVVGSLLIVFVVLMVGHSYYRTRLMPVSGYLGIEFGMSPLDVGLKLGKPNSDETFDDNTINPPGKRKYYVYKETTYSSTLKIIKFTQKDGEFKATLICKSSPEAYDDLIGIHSYSSEADIIKRLGSPTFTSIRADGLAKTISFDKWKVAFQLEKDRVSAMCASESGKVQFIEEYSPR